MQNRIKQLRMERRMTQVRLSIELEVTQETVSAYEKGKHQPSVKSLLKMASLFHVSTDYILGLTDTRSPGAGRRLPEDQQLILALYKDLPPVSKEKALSYMEGLAGQELPYEKGAT